MIADMRKTPNGAFSSLTVNFTDFFGQIDHFSRLVVKIGEIVGLGTCCALGHQLFISLPVRLVALWCGGPVWPTNKIF